MHVIARVQKIMFGNILFLKELREKDDLCREREKIPSERINLDGFMGYFRSLFSLLNLELIKK